MPRIKPEDDPLEFLTFLTSASRMVVTLPIPNGFSAKISELNDTLSFLMNGRYNVSLGDEDKLTDSEAEFAIYTEAPSDMQAIKDLFI